VLRLGQNDVEDADGYLALCRALRRLRGLVIFDGQGNYLTNTGARYVARALGQRAAAFAAAGAAARGGDPLAELDLRECEIGDAGAVAVAEAAAKHLPHLRLLRLAGNKISKDGAEAVKAALAAAGKAAALEDLQRDEDVDDEGKHRMVKDW
jgi:Ran GTPase-activating protein (RanGAP) involved in mRNA processing and transport